MIPRVLSNGVHSCAEAGSVKRLANWCGSSTKSDCSLCRSFRRWQPGPVQSSLEAMRPLGVSMDFDRPE